MREAARLQSFPDGFVFSGSMNSAFRQIGNAVPPLLARAIAFQLMEALQGKETAAACGRVEREVTTRQGSGIGRRAVARVFKRLRQERSSGRLATVSQHSGFLAHSEIMRPFGRGVEYAIDLVGPGADLLLKRGR